MTFLFDSLAAVVLHESTHIAAATLLGVRVKRIGLNWKGPYLVREPGTPAQNLVISAAGPGINLLLALLWPIAPQFAVVNLILGSSNLLPIKGLDGERVWKLWRV